MYIYSWFLPNDTYRHCVDIKINSIFVKQHLIISLCSIYSHLVIFSPDHYIMEVKWCSFQNMTHVITKTFREHAPVSQSVLHDRNNYCSSAVKRKPGARSWNPWFTLLSYFLIKSNYNVIDNASSFLHVLILSMWQQVSFMIDVWPSLLLPTVNSGKT